MKRSELAELSTSDFLNYLETRLPDRSWSLADLLELESRGYEILKPRPQLASVLEQEKSERAAKLKVTLAPLQESLDLMLKISEILVLPKEPDPPTFFAIQRFLDEATLASIKANSPQARQLEALMAQHEVLLSINASLGKLVAAGLRPWQQKLAFWTLLIGTVVNIVIGVLF